MEEIARQHPIPTCDAQVRGFRENLGPAAALKLSYITAGYAWSAEHGCSNVLSTMRIAPDSGSIVIDLLIGQMNFQIDSICRAT